jgi:hypothetical protein
MQRSKKKHNFNCFATRNIIGNSNRISRQGFTCDGLLTSCFVSKIERSWRIHARLSLVSCCLWRAVWSLLCLSWALSTQSPQRPARRQNNSHKNMKALAALKAKRAPEKPPSLPTVVADAEAEGGSRNSAKPRACFGCCC